MFENLQDQPADKIIELIGIYAADPRADKLDLGVGKHRVERAVNGDTLGCLLSEASLQLPARSSGVAFHYGMELEEVRESKDEGGVEGETTEANADNASLDGCHG